MNQNNWEQIKRKYLDHLTDPSEISTMQAIFGYQEAFAQDRGITPLEVFKEPYLSLFKEYLEKQEIKDLITSLKIFTKAEPALEPPESLTEFAEHLLYWVWKTEFLKQQSSPSILKQYTALFSLIENFADKPLSFLLHGKDEPFETYLRTTRKQKKRTTQIYMARYRHLSEVCKERFPDLAQMEPIERQPVFKPQELPEQPQPTTIERKPESEAPQVGFDVDKWISERNYACPDCRSLPFKDKEGLWCVICPKPKEWKDGKYGRIPKGTKGKIYIQICQSIQAYLIKHKLQPEVETTGNAKAEEIAPSGLETVEEEKTSIEEIANQIGICENPNLERQRTLLCVLCTKRNSQKWQACQEIQKELKTSPIFQRQFITARMEKIREEKEARDDPYWWWQAPKTEDMTLEEIEEELGLRQPSKSRRIPCTKFCNPFKIMNCEKYPSCELNTGAPAPTIHEDQPVSQELFDSIRKRYHEVCESCEEHIEHRCTSYCKEFWEGLPSEMKAEALTLKRYPSEEATALRETLRERLKEIVPEVGSDE